MSCRAAAAIAGASGDVVCTSTRPPRGPRPARPASWAISANVRSSARKSGKRSVESASTTTPSVTSGKSWPLGDHLRADQQPGRRRGEAGEQRRARRPWRRRVSASSRNTGTSSASAQLGLQPLRAGAVAGDRRASRRRRSGPARARGGRSGGRRAACSARCSTSATSHCGHSQTFPQVRQVRKFDQPRRLSRRIALRASVSARRVSGCSGWRAPRMSSTSTGGSGRRRRARGAQVREPRARSPGAAWPSRRAAAPGAATARRRPCRVRPPRPARPPRRASATRRAS